MCSTSPPPRYFGLEELKRQIRRRLSGFNSIAGEIQRALSCICMFKDRETKHLASAGRLPCYLIGLRGTRDLA
jgi:hypothetical protein